MKSSSALTTRSASGQNSEIHVWPRMALYERFLALTMVTMVTMVKMAMLSRDNEMRQ